MRLLQLRFLSTGLRSRIIRTTAVVSGLVMAVVIGTVVLALNAATRSGVDASLKDRWLTISTGIETNRDGPQQALASPVDAIQDGTWLFDSRRAQVEGPRAGRRVQEVADSLAAVNGKTSLTRYERVYLAGPVDIRGGSARGPGVLIVSESLTPYENTRTELLLGLIALGLIVTAGTAAIAAWTMSRTLAPVEAMAGLAEDWSEHELDARFEDLGTEDEIAHLGRTLNVLLDRVAGALRGEQRLTSELAHELRTPLSGIRGEAELVLMSGPDRVTRRRLESVVELVDRMSATITTLLAIARGENQSMSRTTVRAVVAATLEHSANRRPGVEVRGVPGVPDDARVSSSTEGAVRALSPLVQNAQEHATTCVDIAVAQNTRTVDITVSDDGPGLVGTADTEALFAAGVRGPDSPGAGLGLALARRVARSLGGDVTVTSPRAPTSFTLTLPKP